MIKSLRKNHRVIWLVLAVLVPVLLGIGWVVARKYHRYYRTIDAVPAVPAQDKFSSGS